LPLSYAPILPPWLYQAAVGQTRCTTPCKHPWRASRMNRAVTMLICRSTQMVCIFCPYIAVLRILRGISSIVLKLPATVDLTCPGSWHYLGRDTILRRIVATRPRGFLPRGDRPCSGTLVRSRMCFWAAFSLARASLESGPFSFACGNEFNAQRRPYPPVKPPGRCPVGPNRWNPAAL